MSHLIATNIADSLSFSMGQRNYIIYLYSSLRAEDFCGEKCWSGVGRSKIFNRSEIKEGLDKLLKMHKSESLDAYTINFVACLPPDFAQKRIDNWGRIKVVRNPPISREDSFKEIKEWYESILRLDFQSINIHFG